MNVIGRLRTAYSFQPHGVPAFWRMTDAQSKAGDESRRYDRVCGFPGKPTPRHHLCESAGGKRSQTEAKLSIGSREVYMPRFSTGRSI